MVLTSPRPVTNVLVMNRRHACLLLSVGLLTGCETARRDQPPVFRPKFAVEFPGSDFFPRGHVTISDYGEVSEPVPCGPAPVGRHECLLELKYAARGDSLIITAAICLDKPPCEDLGEYSGKMGDPVTLSGMRQFGLEPLTLKIVSPEPYSSAPRPKTSARFLPFQIDLVSEDHEFYTLRVQSVADGGNAVRV
jgi:hypothetical protein